MSISYLPFYKLRERGISLLDAAKLFNFDAFSILLNDEEQDFISSITNEWKIISAKLLDLTTVEKE